MTFEERTIVRAAINTTKRAWLESRGGYDVVEKDARELDQKIAGRGRGRSHGTRARYGKGCRCEACRQANADYTTEWARQKALKAEQRKVRQLERRVEDLQVALRLARTPKRTGLIRDHLPTVDSRSTGHIA